MASARFTSRKRAVPEQLEGTLNHLNPDRTEALLKDLINIYSPTWKEHEVQAYLSHYLQRHGVEPIEQAVDNTGRSNLYAKTRDGAVDLLFIGHTDTVQKWYQGDFRFRQEGTMVYGLGAADMKSGCAALLEAFLSLAPLFSEPDSPNLAIAFVVGEEEDGDGIQALLEILAPKVAVVAEPTGMQLCDAHYGYLEVLLTTHGRRAHSALPEVGHNAIEVMLNVIRGLMEPLTKSDPDGKRPALVCNLREVRGGGSAFVVPEYCEAIIDLHFPPSLLITPIKEELRRILRAVAEREPRHRCQIHFKVGFNGYKLNVHDPDLMAIKNACSDVGFQPPQEVFRSHSDANCLRLKGTRPVVIGPGDLTTAHTVHERVSIRELHLATQLYCAMGLRYLEQHRVVARAR